MPNVFGFIPARGASKELPRKNIQLLNAKPLLVYSVEAALNSMVCNEVVVSTEDDEISDVAMKAGAIVDQRSADLAQDESTMDEVIEEFIKRRELADDDVIVLLRPTSPLRNDEHIKEAFQWYRENADHQCHAQALLSVYKIDSRVLHAYCEEGAFMKPVCEWAPAIYSRHSLPHVYLPNGAINIFNAGGFREANQIPKHHIVPFVMTEQESVDIDTEDDFRRCSYYLMNLPERRSL